MRRLFAFFSAIVNRVANSLYSRFRRASTGTPQGEPTVPPGGDPPNSTAAPAAADDAPTRASNKQPVRWTLLVLGIVWVLSLVGQFVYFTWWQQNTDMFSWTWIMLYVQFAYVLMSFGTVAEDRVAALILFGYPLEEISSGLYFAPWGIFSLRTDKVTFFQMELPAEPELIYHGKEAEVPEGKYPPIRVTSATKEAAKDTSDADPPLHRYLSEDSKDPLDNDRITYEVTPIVRWKIQLGEYVTFLRTIGSPEEVRRQFSDTATAFAVEDLSRCTVAYMLKNLSSISDRLHETLERITHASSATGDTADPSARNNWGIALDMARIKQPSFHRNLNEAIAKPAVAKLDAAATIAAAEAQKQKLTLEGEGIAAAEKSLIDARTDALTKQRTELGISGELALAAETARGITDNPGQKTVIAGSGGFSDLIGGVIGVAETLKDKAGPSPTTTGDKPANPNMQTPDTNASSS